MTRGGRRVYETTVTVRNVPGIHARPAAELVKKASLFKCQIQIGTDRLMVNAKSIMGVMMLAAETGTVLVIRATGPDERAAAEALKGLIEARFGE